MSEVWYTKINEITVSALRQLRLRVIDKEADNFMFCGLIVVGGESLGTQRRTAQPNPRMKVIL